MKDKALGDTPGGRIGKNMKKGRIPEVNPTKFGLQKVMILEHFSLLGAPWQGKREFWESFLGMSL